MDEVNFLPTFPLFAANLMLVGAVLLCGLATEHVESSAQSPTVEGRRVDS